MNITSRPKLHNFFPHPSYSVGMKLILCWLGSVPNFSMYSSWSGKCKENVQNTRISETRKNTNFVMEFLIFEEDGNIYK